MSGDSVAESEEQQPFRLEFSVSKIRHVPAELAIQDFWVIRRMFSIIQRRPVCERRQTEREVVEKSSPFAENLIDFTSSHDASSPRNCRISLSTCWATAFTAGSWNFPGTDGVRCVPASSMALRYVL